MKIVLFACVHNAGRSQMAAGFFNAIANPEKAKAISAGTEPAKEVNPDVVLIMKEEKINILSAHPQKLTEDIAQKAHLLITMGCGEACPVVPGLRREDWPLQDPKGQSIETIRKIRDDIKQRVEQLIAAEGWLADSSHHKA